MRHAGGGSQVRGTRTAPTRRRALASLLTTALVGSAIAVVGLATDHASALVPAVAPTISTLDGSTSSTAAASCWEIKQLFPASVDGVYWIRTATLQRPEQFYCDMTTDGGGWVLIGRGREGWTFRDFGQQTTEAVRSTINGPAAFEPAALSTELIDGLLDGGAVKDLVDGVRLVRARNATGTQWQDVRWRFADLGTWSWAIGGGHRLSSFSINGVAGTGSNTKDSRVSMANEVGAGNRGAKNEFVWFTYPWSGHDKNAGFSYGGGISGSNNSTTYLYEFGTENQAVPFTQMFIRPQLTTPVLEPIGDAGIPAATIRPQLSDRPAEIAGGVAGVLKVGDTEPQVDAPVLAITTLGDRVYVGGKFSQVRDTSTGKLVNRSYLAAFDRRTGAWIPSFAPVLDGTVWDLDVAGGRLIVAGQFTNVNGVAGTSALAALDPIAGQVDPTWRASLTISGTTNRPFARTIAVEGDWIYVGGNFTRVAGATVARGAGRLARVAVANGNPDNRFTPNVGGVPYHVDVDSGRAYVVGKITAMNGEPHQAVAVVDATTGVNIAGLAPAQFTAANASAQYQQAILALGSEVWQGGSEHNTHVYRASDYSLIKRYVGADQGGDIQAMEVAGPAVYTGSHGNAWIYHDGATWPGLEGYTRADIYNWIGAFDPTSHEYDKSFVPSIRSANNEGAWALHTDVDGCLWFGGDFAGGPFVGGVRQYLEGFSKFCPKDQAAPTVPRNPTATSVAGGGVQVRWGSSSDTTPGYLGYEILRNDRVVSGLVYGSTFVDPTGQPGDRYFVRAIDVAGNRSATTAVFVASDTVGPSAPTGLAAAVLPDASIDLTWTASIDDVGVATYRVIESGQTILEVPGTDTHANVLGLGVGTHSLSVLAVDTTGNLSARSDSVTVEVTSTDTVAPTTPAWATAVYDLTTRTTTVSWDKSTDNVSIANYIVREGTVDLATVGPDVLWTTLTLPAGTHTLSVVARDGAGNVSVPAQALAVDVIVPDTVKPTVPTSPSAVVNPDGTVTVSWTASTDNVGVTSYRITRNGVEVLVVPGTQTSAVLTTLGPGTHNIQLQAFDAAGNASAQTASVVVTVVGADTVRPKAPRDLVTSVNADGSVAVSWTASTDNVGVTSYRITRNGVEALVVPGTQTSAVLTTLGPGTHYIQMQAFDAAGNASAQTASSVVTVVGADTVRPKAPGTPAAVVNPDGTVTVSWTASTDNVGVTSYRITRNGVEVLVVPGTQTSAVLTTLGLGTHYIQLQAFDAAGNASAQTASAVVTVVGADTERPKAPGTPAAVVNPDGTVTVSWTASTDNVGVTSYRITRNGVEVLVVPGTATSGVVPGLGAGTHYIQLQAFDAAGNASRQTSSVVVTI